MPADHVAVGRADLRLPGEVARLVGDEPGHAHDVLGPAAGLVENCHDVFQRLPDLADEIVRLEDLVAVPADLAAEPDGAALRDHAVGIAPCRLPAAWVQGLNMGGCTHRILLKLRHTALTLRRRDSDPAGRR